MKRVAEIIYITESERAQFLNGALNLTDEEKNVLWLCGVRKQQYFALNDYIFMTFEYEGNDFNNDMDKMAAYLDSKGLLVKNRRKDVPVEDRNNVNWWAPVKKLGDVLNEKPVIKDEAGDLSENYMAMLDGGMTSTNYHSDTSYDDDDWTECVRIW